jgi:phosphatidylinositol alpha-mannosyltransferase
VRVCIVVPYDLGEEGGVKRHALHIMNALRRAGDEVEMVGPLRRGPVPPHVQGFGGVVNVPANGSANHMALLVPPWSVRRYFRERRFDVVHLHEPMVPMLGYYALWFSPGSTHVATFHMYAEAEPSSSRAARFALARLLFPRLDAAIAVSPAAAEFVAPLWRRPLPVIPNGVPTDVFHPNGGDVLDGAVRPRLLFVGNWRDSRKGLPVLLEACRRLAAQGVNFSLDVIGAGTPDEEQLRVPGVTFHGSIASESVLADCYRKCDLFIAPATGQESFGIVLLEAMASARPVICSDIRGFRDVIDPQGAEFVSPGDAGGLARAIATLARTPDIWRRMGARNRARAEAYDWDRIAPRVREVYLEAMAVQRRNVV